jgi:hypothetical protein
METALIAPAALPEVHILPMKRPAALAHHRPIHQPGNKPYSAAFTSSVICGVLPMLSVR